MRTQVKLIFIKKNTVFEEGECMEINSDFHIVYASDNKFAEILGVSMVSLFQNNKDANSITLYILDGGISEQNKKRLDEICFTYGRGLPIWIQAVNIQEIIG
jgi:glycosyltransferase family 8